MSDELRLFAEKMDAAKLPEDVFGPTCTPRALKLRFRQFVKIAHVDLYPNQNDKVVAQKAFIRLTDLHEEAKHRMRRGIYGQTVVTKPVDITTKRTTYTIDQPFTAGDVADLYRGRDPKGGEILLKVARGQGLNDLMEREAAVLKQLNAAADKTRSFGLYIPKLIETVMLHNGREYKRANVFEWRAGYYPLTEVMAHYPEGVDGRHMVWMWNRLLSALGYVHQEKIVHGAVLPVHVLVHPETHGLLLVDWCYAVPAKTCVRAYSKGYKGFYPPEVLSKMPATAATDLYMAAGCMAYVLGGDKLDLPASVPDAFRRFLSTCWLPNPARRPQEAWPLYDLFGGVAEEVYGPKRFVKFDMTDVAEGV